MICQQKDFVIINKYDIHSFFTYLEQNKKDQAIEYFKQLVPDSEALYQEVENEFYQLTVENYSCSSSCNCRSFDCDGDHG